MKKVLAFAIAFFLSLGIFANIKFQQYNQQTEVLKTRSDDNNTRIELVWEKINAFEPQLIAELNATTQSQASSQRQFESNDTLMKISGLVMTGSLSMFALACLVLSIAIRNSDE